MRQSVFYPTILSYTLGIFIRSFFLLSFSFQFFCAFWSVVALAILGSLGLMYDDAPIKRYSIIFLIVVGMLSVSLGALRYSFFDLYRGDPLLATIVAADGETAKNTIRAEGVIVAEPDERGTSVRLTIALDTLIGGNSTEGGSRISLAPTKVIMSADPRLNVSYGDRVSVDGVIARPENFVGDTGRIFDYISYLAKDRIVYEIDHPNVRFISGGHGSRILEAILFLKAKFLKGLDSVIPDPESSLGAGLVIAGKRALPADIQGEFEKSGTIQVIVLSGYNVTVVAETLASLFSFLPVIAGASLGAAGIVVFTVAAGATATVVRASLMAAIVIIAKLLRRRYNVLRALIFSAFIMLIANPFLLVSDPSFQLSFIATFGLIAVSPMLEPYFLFLPEALALRATTVATIATQLFVLPFLLYLTGSFSLVAVPANLLIFLFIPMTMLFCFLAGAAASLATIPVWPLVVFLHPVASLVAVPATALLHYELFIVRVFASLPFASFSIPAFPAWVMFVIYAGYGVIVGRFYHMKQPASDSTNAAVTAILQRFHSSPAGEK